MKPNEQQEFPDISYRPEAMFASQVLHAYVDTARSLGKSVDWSVFDCIYDKTKEKMEKHVAMREDLLRSELCKKDKDGQFWFVLIHPLSELWMNEKGDTFKIVFKTGRVVKFGCEENKTPYIEGI